MKKSSLIMGVLNVTPDSFSDGGEFLDPDDSKKHIEKLIADGADIIDIGAQSSRPGAQAIGLNEELARLTHIFAQTAAVHSTAGSNIKFSIDTDRPEIMLKAAASGFSYINNINGLESPELLRELLVVNPQVRYIAMHKHGAFKSMQENPLSTDKDLMEIEEFLQTAHKSLLSAGFSLESIWLDPGVGFGKDDRLNLKIIQRSAAWSKRYNMLYGVSRKSFIGRLLGIKNPVDRDLPSKMLECSLILSGVQMVRTHDVRRLFKIRETILP